MRKNKMKLYRLIWTTNRVRTGTQLFLILSPNVSNFSSGTKHPLLSVWLAGKSVKLVKKKKKFANSVKLVK